MRILLVEDNPDHAHLVCTCLKNEFGLGLRIEIAQSGEEALERLEMGNSLDEPDLLILDFYLPGISGIQVLTHLMDFEDPCPVVLVTSSDDQRLAMKAMRYGANDFVLKGADFPENLVGAVARAFAHSRLQRDLSQAQAHLEHLDVPSMVVEDHALADRPIPTATDPSMRPGNDRIEKLFRFSDELKARKLKQRNLTLERSEDNER